jgi:hypothetical protein
MLGVASAKDLLGFRLEIGAPEVSDVKGAEHDPFGVAESKILTNRDFLGRLFRNVEGDRQWPESSILETHVGADPLIVGSGHESCER